MIVLLDRTIAAEPRAQPRPRRRGRWPVVTLAMLTAIAGAGWADRETLLRGLAEAWVIADPPTVADAVAVFGGGIETRPFAAAEYYHRRLVKEVLVSNDRESRPAALGIVPSDAAASRAVLLRLGVPAEAIHTFGAGLANTHMEALALRDWATAHQVHSILVPTEIFAARRLRWTLDQVFGGAIGVSVPALDPPNYGVADWWRQESGIVSFQNEILKYVYYRLRY